MAYNQKKTPFYLDVGNSALKALKAGGAPWNKGGKGVQPLPINPKTGIAFRGVNALYLSMQGYDDPRWLTYKQAKSLGGQVRAGEKGTQVQYWQWTDTIERLDAAGNSVKETVPLDKPKLFTATVFNAQQISNLPDIDISDFAVNQNENRFAGRNAKSLTVDALKAIGIDRVGEETEGKESLTVELASYLLSATTDVKYEPSSSDIDVWIKMIEEDPKIFLQSAANAQRIVDHVNSLELEPIAQQETTTVNQGNENVQVSTGNIREDQGIKPASVPDVNGEQRAGRDNLELSRNDSGSRERSRESSGAERGQQRVSSSDAGSNDGIRSRKGDSSQSSVTGSDLDLSEHRLNDQAQVSFAFDMPQPSKTLEELRSKLNSVSGGDLDNFLRGSGLRIAGTQIEKIDRLVSAREAADTFKMFDSLGSIDASIQAGEISKEKVLEWYRATKKPQHSENSAENFLLNSQSIWRWGNKNKAFDIPLRNETQEKEYQRKVDASNESMEKYRQEIDQKREEQRAFYEELKPRRDEIEQWWDALNKDQKVTSSMASGASEKDANYDASRKQGFDGLSNDRKFRLARYFLDNEAELVKAQLESIENSTENSLNHSVSEVSEPVNDSGSLEPLAQEESNNKNYRITENDELGSGGALTKARANIEAIKIVKTLQAENRPATTQEKEALVKYTGWGASSIANSLFPTKGEPQGSWKDIRRELDSLLSSEELETAQRSTQYAHYTSKSIIDSIYDAVEGFGFESGLVLEGGMGTGHFAGLMPEKLHTAYYGVEMDGISAQIAKALYPESSVIHGDFTKIGFPENHFDMTIGNPPFSSTVIKSDPKYKDQGLMIHDYFITKQIDSIKPGGIAAFVTSKSTMDKSNTDVRESLANKASFLGAIRLPQTAFKQNAGTEVVTDILFFQKKAIENDEVISSTLGRDQAWVNLKEINTEDGPCLVNEYFANHPEMILGESRLTGSMYRENEYTVIPNGDLDKQLKEAIKRLPTNIVKDNPSPDLVDEKARMFDFGESRKEDSFYIGAKGDLRKVTDGYGQPVPIRGGTQRSGLSKKQAEIVRDYIPLRDAVMDVFDKQMNDGDWKSAQGELHKVYDHFVAKHGPINQSKTIVRKDGVEVTQEPIIAALDLDPELHRVAAIEVYDAVENKAAKNDIFFEKVVSKKPEQNIESAIDALSVTLNDRGYLDFDYLEEKYPQGNSRQEIIDELGDAIFFDPRADRWVTDDDYLSGNVKQKLDIAKKALSDNPKLQRNVDALEGVLPEDMPLAKIPMNLGAHWIPAKVVQKFAEERLGFNGSVSSLIKGENSSWNVDGHSRDEQFATARLNCVEVLSHALNKKTPVIRDTFLEDGTQRTEINRTETTAAAQKVQDLKDEFQRWALADIDVAASLHRIYNRDFNTTVPRKFNGKHLQLPRLATKYKPHAWQRNVVWRIAQKGNTYMAHDVGAGKTLASCIAGMELKRLGLANKPTFVVLKSTLKQFATEFLEAYPDAKLLVADEKQLDQKNRRRFLGKIANNDYDAIIMTHESFERIPLSDEFMNKYIEKEIKEYRGLLETIDESERGPRKRIEKQIESLEQKLEASASSATKDKGVTFEETGIDFLFVDEAHHHKKIPFPTNQTNTKGVDANGSGRAFDLFLKTRYLNEVKPNRNLVLMSGTPVTNTLGEVFNIQRYLQPNVLERNKISSFDSWSATFADTVTELEMQPSGNFKPSTRLAKFVGVPSLLRDFLQVADIVGSKDLNESLTIKRPEVIGGGREVLTVSRTSELRQYQRELGQRIQALENKKGPPRKGEDNILVVINDGRKAAYDMRLVGRPQVGPSKVDKLIDEVYQTWKDTKNNVYFSKGKEDAKKGSTQLIFTEIIESKGFNVYDYIREELVKKGVPKEEVAFIQEANNSNKKRKLFREMNTGVKRILIGGSKNMGTGVNVQQRLIALHHLDIDYLPSNIVQREGRAVRQGNKNDKVSIKAYATEGTVDAFMWQLNESKQKMIDQVMSGNLSIDSVEDISDNANQMAMAKALASGNPLLLEQAGLAGEVKKLQSLKSAHYNQRLNNRGKLSSYSKQNEVLNRDYARIEKLSKQFVSTKGDSFLANLGSTDYTERSKAGAAIIREGYRVLDSKAFSSVQIGAMAGYDLFMKPQGDSLVVTVGGSDTRELGDYLPSVRFSLDDVSEAGLVRRIENAAASISSLSSEISESIKENQLKIDSITNALTSEFQYEDDLQSKIARLEEVNHLIENYDADSEDIAESIIEAENTVEDEESSLKVEKKADEIAEILLSDPAFEERFRHDSEQVVTSHSIEKAILEHPTFVNRRDDVDGYKEFSNTKVDDWDVIEAVARSLEKKDAISNLIGDPSDDSKEEITVSSFHKEVASQLVESLRIGQSPWQVKQDTTDKPFQLPFNPESGKRFNGINCIHLLNQDYDDPRWMTRDQAEKAGGHVKEGEKGTTIQYWVFSDEKTITGANGEPVLNEDGSIKKEVVELERPRSFLSTVFNAEQVDDFPALEERVLEENPLDKAQFLLARSGAKIEHVSGGKSFYDAAADTISLPEKNSLSEERYFEKAIHELVHWSGNSGRLDRDLSHPFGSEEYAREELRAAIASMIIGAETGIGNDPFNHASYTDVWVKLIEDDPTEILRAATDAEKMQSYVASIGQDLSQSLTANIVKSNTEQALDDVAKRVPENIKDKYISIEGKYFYLDSPRSLAFEDKGNSLETNRVDSLVVSSIVDIAEARVWKEINVNGSNDFKRAVWLEASYRGLDVKGFSPTIEDLSSLEAYKRTNLNPAFNDDIEASISSGNNSVNKNGLSGRLVEFGSAPFEHDNRNSDSYFVTYVNDKGIERTVWGVDLERALDASGANIGDVIALENQGKQEVEVESLIKDEDGNVVDREMITTHRNTWHVDLISAENVEVMEDNQVNTSRVNNDLEKEVEAAVSHEEAVRNDPNSTDDDILAAKKQRQDADLKLVLSDNEIAATLDAKGKAGEISLDVAYINVPFKDKDEVKSLGAKWNRKEQSWFIPSGVNKELFSKWENNKSQSKEPSISSKTEKDVNKVYLAVPYSDKELAKKQGAKWDKAANSWFVFDSASIDKFKQWLPNNVHTQQAPAMSPREEFAEALQSMGCIVSDPHPIMDGGKHRIKTDGDRAGETAGFYIGHLDGHPAGYIINNRTGDELKWKSKGYALNPDEKAKLQAEAAIKNANRASKLKDDQEKAAVRVKNQIDSLFPIEESSPYLEKKDIKSHKGALTDESGLTTFIPVQDINGNVMTMQYINEDGSKRFAKDGKKEGGFHIVGGNESLLSAPVIVIAEGYATAATACEALGFATIAAFDAGNLQRVAMCLHDKYPEKPIIIAGDDDSHLEMSLGNNPGREKANAAAKSVGGKAIFPIFAVDEKDYPQTLDVITPELFKNKSLLSDEQLCAYDKMKRYTDFNDLATKSKLGKDAVKRQIGSAVSLSLKKFERPADDELALVNMQTKQLDKKQVKKNTVML